MFPRLFLTVLFLLTRISFLNSAKEQGVVRAVLFYSPTCGHCHFVMQETLPVLMEQYGHQLQIIGIDVTRPQGEALFASAREMFGLKTSGVPFLVVGNEYLIGSSDIPNKFPPLIEQYLAKGGVDWPAIPGLVDAIQANHTAEAPTPAPTPIQSTAAVTSMPTNPAAITREPVEQTAEPFALPAGNETSVWERVMLDPVGNGLAIFVLIIMILAVVRITLSFRQNATAGLPDTLQILIPILCVVGLGIAGYLTYVETTQTTAMCGPVGDCNTVQQSEYARLFGLLPIGLLGMIGYISILLTWVLGKIQKEPLAMLGKVTAFGLATCGIAFSIYLTFLEPFIIGATCAWCIASAILMSSLFMLTFPEGRHSLSKLMADPSVARRCWR